MSFRGLRGSSVNDKVFTLSSDYNLGVRYPTVLTFPMEDITSPDTVKSPIYNDLFQLRNLSFAGNKKPESKLTLFKSSELTETVKLHYLVLEIHMIWT